MNLCAFAGRYVLLQFKQPYTLVLPYAQGEKPMPMILGLPGAASAGAPAEKQQPVPLHVPFVMGKVKVLTADYGTGEAVVQFMDQNNVKMEVMVTDDMIFSVSAVSQDTIVVP